MRKACSRSSACSRTTTPGGLRRERIRLAASAPRPSLPTPSCSCARNGQATSPASRSISTAAGSRVCGRLYHRAIAPTLPWRGRVGLPKAVRGGVPGDAARAEALSPPPGPLARADLPPPGGGDLATALLPEVSGEASDGGPECVMLHGARH